MKFFFEKPLTGLSVILCSIILVSVLTGCNNNTDLTTSTGVSSLCLVSPSEGESFITAGMFQLDLNYSEDTAILSGKELTLDNNRYSFTLPAAKFTISSNALGLQAFTFTPGIGMIDGSAMTVEAGQCIFTTNTVMNTPRDGYKPVRINTYPLVKLTLGDRYTLRTFPSNAVYLGMLKKITFGEDGQPIEEKLDKVLMSVDVDSKQMSAQVSFSSGAIAQGVQQYRGLKVVPNRDGYTIKSVDEGGIEIHTASDNLVSVIATYSSESLSYTFTGSYVAD